MERTGFAAPPDRRLVEIRKQNPALGLGTCTELPSPNLAVLAYLRETQMPDREEEAVMFLNNVPRFAQPVELGLKYSGESVPAELLDGMQFPSAGELPYLLTVNGHGFHCFRPRHRN